MTSTKSLGKSIRRLRSSSAKLVARYPCMILSFIMFFGGILFALTLWLVPFPTFQDPIKDFMPYNTPISNRRVAKEKLNRMLEYKELFTVNDMINFYGKSQSAPVVGGSAALVGGDGELKPGSSGVGSGGGKNRNDFRFRNSRPNSAPSNNFALIMSSNDDDLFGSSNNGATSGNEDDDDDNDEILASILSNVESKLKRSTIIKRRARRDLIDQLDEMGLELDEPAQAASTRIFFSECDPILSEHCSQIIIESKEPARHSLLSLEAVSLECQLVEQYLKPYMQSLLSMSLYETTLGQAQPSVRFESLSSVVARFAGKRSCSDIDEPDVHNFTLVMGNCANIYRKLAAFDLMPIPTLEQTEELRILPICRDRLFVDSYKYLLDRDFYFRDGTDFNEINLESLFANKRNDLPDFQDQAIVRFTSIYFSVPKNDTRFLMPFYTTYLEPNFLNKPLENNRHFIIAAVNFDIKIELFNAQIGSSFYNYLTFILFFLFICSFAYSKSPILALGLVTTVVFVLVESYGIQKLLVRDDSFSFLHISSTLMLTLMACAHAFVLADAWTEAKLKFKNALLIDNQFDIVDPTTSTHLKNKVRSVCSSVGNRRHFDLVGGGSGGGISHFNRLESRSQGGNGIGGLSSAIGSGGGGGIGGSCDDQEEYLRNCVEYLIKNGTYPTLVGVLTRIVCLFAELNSSIGSIKFFAIYAILTSLFYLFTSTIGLTCCLVVQMKHLHRFKFKTVLSKLRLDRVKWIYKAHNVISNLQYFYQSMFELWLPSILINFRLMFLAVLLLASLPGMFVVLVRPSIGRQLTQTAASIRLFAPAHPLEAYDRRFSEFASTHESVNTGVYPFQQEMIPRMRVSFLFGVKPSHQHLRTSSLTDQSGFDAEFLWQDLEFDKENFDFYDERSQLWFLTFCKALKREFKPKISSSSSDEKDSRGSNSEDDSHDFLESEEDWDNLSSGNLCLIDLLKIVFTRRCSNDPNDFVGHVCCDQISPFDSNILQLCLRNVTFLERYIMPYQSILSERLYFNKTNGIVVAVEIQQSTPHRWTSNYKSMSNIYSELESFFRKQIEHKYVKLDHLDKSQLKKNLVKYAFFESEFEFFDFQKSILTETLESLVISDLVLAALVFFATFNFLITVFAVITLVLCQSTVLGVLILIGWQIDLLESIGIVMSGALCIEATFHLAIQYTNLIGNSNESDQEFASTIFFIREHTIKNVIARIGSALTITTLVILILSIFLTQSSLAIIKLYGVYFIITSFIGFLYGVFFFVPLCASFGPLSNYCRIRNNKKSEKSFIEFKRANRAIKNVGNKIAHPIHTTAI